MREILRIFVLGVLIISFSACKKVPYYKYEGYIQGTTFSVIYQCKNDIAPKIDSLLNRFNQSLDNYDSTSIISQVNLNHNPVTDSLFEYMFQTSQKVWQETNGRFDITVAPLANAWGFGYKTGQMPDSTTIDSLVQFVGFEKIELKNHHIVKTDPRVKIIGNAIAQGMSVDYVSAYLESIGVINYMVEIGGELFAKGESNSQKEWLIGIDKPIQDSLVSDRQIMTKIMLNNKAVATSGNYRKYHIIDGHAMGHALNPKTGYPEMSEILSATVIHDQCIFADAWATALMLMDAESAMNIVNNHSEMEAMLILGNPNDTCSFNIVESDNFSGFLSK